MVKVRQDAWSHEDDLLLAETVLRHIREGSTQLNAFDEVGDKLNRTSAACGFRWNAEVRMKYDNAIDLAKRQRKEKKRAMAANSPKQRQPVIALPSDTEAEEKETPEIHIEQPEEQPEQHQEPAMTMDMVIRYLRQVKKDYHASNQSIAHVEQLQQENTNLQDQVSDLEKQLKRTETKLESIQEDYQVFMTIMDRARKMTVLDDKGSLPAPAFRMDKNGNLQQVAQSGSQ
ncbi:RsfA family transcriptional regulator [Lentibacillus sediminis]|uniref:RsfA family transcriptional regulator n=1 Tax=Lentibacillus sediminis TaxID=1940529 RepID=UPI000C1C7AA3|nr:RsfA family transcriptional regulator [Lentibacillus sediminis]